jgi:hypothetical protein
MSGALPFADRFAAVGSFGCRRPHGMKPDVTAVPVSEREAEGVRFDGAHDLTAAVAMIALAVLELSAFWALAGAATPGADRRVTQASAWPSQHARRGSEHPNRTDASARRPGEPEAPARYRAWRGALRARRLSHATKPPETES